jgi:glutathione synthase/RimK-type ligase-like ATP-grasp enzyme
VQKTVSNALPHDTIHAPAGSTPLLGLAALMRLHLAGADMAALGRQLVARAEADTSDACALMDASIVLQFLGQRDLALAMQRLALQSRRHYCLPAARQPAKLRLLALLGPGDLMANVPIECLLEDSDVDLHLFYVLPEDGDSPTPVPDHDLAFVAIGETEGNRPLLTRLEADLAHWPRPVLNRPERIGRVARDRASAILRGLPGVAMPPTARVRRAVLADVAAAEHLPGGAFPVIVRPLDSHAGHDLEKVDTPDALAKYLAAAEGEAFFVSPFVDYRSPDGMYRKYRIALIDGHPFSCHMGVSSHWMIHYLNAGMAESADKRAEEARFMAAFDQDFARRHGAALAAINAAIGLDYLCIDCAEAADGRLLIFEVDHAMVVHALDPVDVFPYKQPQMRKVFAAFRDMLGRSVAGGTPAAASAR